MFKIISLLLIISCSTPSNRASDRDALKDFSPRELITSSRLLTKIYDEEMKPLECVPDTDSAQLLLRTLRPRLEVVIDDIEVALDKNEEVASLVNNCQSDCTCEFIDDIFREHQITLSQTQSKKLQQGIRANEKTCLSARAKIFCTSPLFQELEKEKVDFSFE